MQKKSKSKKPSTKKPKVKPKKKAAKKHPKKKIVKGEKKKIEPAALVTHSDPRGAEAITLPEGAELDLDTMHDAIDVSPGEDEAGSDDDEFADDSF